MWPLINIVTLRSIAAAVAAQDKAVCVPVSNGMKGASVLIARLAGPNTVAG